MLVRKNYRDLSTVERDRFVQALHHVKSTGIVDQFASEHATHFFHGIHRSSHFLPWHREFVRRFEDELQAFHPEITVPYWNSTVDTSPSDPLWDNAFLGQFDAAWGLNRALGSAMLPTPQRLQQTLGLNDYDSFWRDLESFIHNSPHNWVGGVMASVSSPGDPVFFLHHCWIDRVWAEWQVSLDHAGPAFFTSSGPGVGLNDPLMGWPTTAADVLDHHALDYRYDFEGLPVEMVVGNFAYNAGGWRVERHPRFLAELTGDGRADILGFGDAGVWTSLNNGDGTFQGPQFVVANFGYTGGGWRVERHPRDLADLTGDGRADIVGFGDAGVWVSLNNGTGTFQNPQMVVGNFAYNAGGWRVERHPRVLADLTGDGRADIVGFGDAGVWVSLNNGNGSFQVPEMRVANFAYSAGGWRVERHPRFVADLTGDGRGDIVGFGDGGVWVALNNGDGTFQTPQLAVANFGYTAGGWRVERHPRFLANLTGDGRADIVGFGDAGVWVSLNNGDGTFQNPQMVVGNFAYSAGSWRVERHPRFLADVTGDGRADIVGFGDAGVWVSFNNGNGTFQAPQKVVSNFAYNVGGWRVERHPRFMADITGDGRADFVGFGDAGVWVAISPDTW